MIIHLGFVILCIIVGILWDYRVRPETAYGGMYPVGQSRYKTELTPWLIVFTYLVIMAALRTSVNDSGTYRVSFERQEATWSALRTVISNGGEWAFDGVAILFKMFVSDNYHAWFGFFAFLQAVLLINILRKESVSPFYTLYYFSCSALYINFLSMMRQLMAVLIIFNGAVFLKRRKVIPYCILCLIASRFHESALLMIPLYFVVLCEPWSKRMAVLGAVSLLIFYNIERVLSFLSGATDPETYGYVFDAMSKDTGSSPIRALVYLAPLILAFMYREHLTSPLEKVSINILFLQFLATLLASFTNGIYVIRFTVYLHVYLLLFYPLLMRRIKEANDGNAELFNRMFVIMYAVYYFYFMLHSNSFIYSSDIIGQFS